MGGALRKTALIAAMLMFVSLVSIPTADAQILPDVQLSCDQDYIILDSSPGAGSFDLACTATNPTAFTEAITLDSEVVSSEISISAPGSMTLAPSSTEDFTITFVTSIGQESITSPWNISAIVTTANGIPVEWMGAADEIEGEVMVEVYSVVSCDMSSMTVHLESGESRMIDVEVANDGNRAEHHVLEVIDLGGSALIIDANPDGQGEADIEPGGSATLRFNVTAPSFDQDMLTSIEVKTSFDGSYDCGVFDVNVAKVPESGLGGLGESVGLDSSTTIMIASVGGGGLALLLLLMIALKVKSSRSKAGAVEDDDDDEDWDDLDEIDDEDDLDFDDL